MSRANLPRIGLYRPEDSAQTAMRGAPNSDIRATMVSATGTRQTSWRPAQMSAS